MTSFVLVSDWFRPRWRLLRRGRSVGPPLDCPLCSWRGPSLVRGLHPAERHCPRCKSSNRHRLAAWYVARERLSGPGIAVLHVAPEASLGRILASTAGSYVTCDLCRRDVDHRLDLQSEIVAERAFGLIVVNHVLEHVPDDRAALRSLRRMLAPGGTLLATVPMRRDGGPTDEDPAVVTRAERRARFGQDDHLRIYGEDFEARLQEAGLDTWTVRSADADPAVVRAKAMEDEVLFLGRRPPAESAVTGRRAAPRS